MKETTKIAFDPIEFTAALSVCLAAKPEHNAKLRQFCRYAELLMEANSTINLISTASMTELAQKHFADALELAAFIGDAGKMIDVGSGAGFPGLVLAIAKPEMPITLAEALGKRCKFLSQVKTELSLGNVEIIQARAEELGQSPLRETYQYAVARAVAPLNILLEYLLPLCKIGGQGLAMKGPKADLEIAAAANSLETLGGKVAQLHQYTLLSSEERRIIVIEKICPTPAQYPRKPGRPEKRPL